MPEQPAGSNLSRRKLIVLNCAAMAQHGIVLLLVGSVLPYMMKSLDIAESSAGIMLAVGSLGFTLGPMIAGTIADRSQVKRALMAGLAIELVALCFFGFVPAFGFAVVTAFTLRFGAAFVETSVNIIPAFIEKRGKGDSRKVGSLMNLIHFFFSVGALVAPLLAGLVLKTTGSWRPVFWIGAGLTAALALVLLPADLPSAASHQRGEKPQKRFKAAELLNPTLILGALALMLYVGAEVVVSSWIVYYLEQGLGFTAIVATSGLSVLWMGLAVGRYLNSVLARYLPSKRLVVGAGILGLASGLGLLTAREPVAVYAWLGVLGLSMSGVFPTVMAEINSRNPRTVGVVTGVMTVAASVGALISQLLVGFVAEGYGIGVAIAIPGVLMGTVALVFAFVPVLRQEPTE